MVAQLDRQYWRIAGSGASARRATSYLMFEGRPATTRGQWFNPIVRWNLSHGERTKPRAPVDRPIFVLGVGRSGTTHLGRLLSAHPEVAWLNEPKLMWNRLVPDEDVSGFYSARGRFRLTADDVTPELTRRASAMIDYYLRCVRGRRLVDKYPEMTYRAAFLKQLFPDAILIAIVRRPEDFVNSVINWNEVHTSGAEDWWGVKGCKWALMRDELVASDPEVGGVLDSLGRDPSPAEKSATEWVLGMRSLIQSRGLLDMLIRYEDLATNPGATVEALLEVCHLSKDPKVLTFAEESTSDRLRTDPADFGGLSPLVAQTRALLGV